MVQYRLPSSSPASSGSAESHEEEVPSAHYNRADHGYTIGLPDTGNDNRNQMGPATPTKSIELPGWPRLLQSPLPDPPVPGAWPLNPMSSPQAALQVAPPVPIPPVAFPPTLSHPNRIATAPEPIDGVQVALDRIGIVRIPPRPSPQRLQRPVGKPYSGPRVTMAPRGVPTSPQRPGVERSWTTWWYDGATRNFIPAVATEIVSDAGNANWENLIYLLHVTGHAHIVRLLDGSQLPKRDAQSGAFVQRDGQLVEKSLTDLAHLAGWNEQQWKRQRLQWRQNGLRSEPDVMPGVFPYPFLVWERIDGKPLSMILKKRPDGVEEAFIWYFLLSLLDAVRWLHHGLSDQSPPDESDWRAVVHNNINPDNIWLNRPLTPDVRYGTLKLGNFSRAVVLDRSTLGPSGSSLPKERFQPEEHQRRPQHEHFDAPELSWMFDTDPEEANLLEDDDYRLEESPTACSPVGGKSDIWSVGAVAVALMGGIWIDPEDISLERWRKVSREKTFVLQTVQLYQMRGKRWDSSLLPSRYSLALRTVLEKLLTLDPIGRVDALQAHALVTEEYEKWLEEQDPVNGNEGEDDAIDSDASDDDRPATRRPPRLDEGRHNGPPPHGSDDGNDDDDWRPKWKKPRDDQSRSPRRPKSPSDRPVIVRKQNAGPRRDPTRYTIHGQPRFSATSGLVRVGAGYQRPDRPPNPFSPTRARRFAIGTSGRTARPDSPAAVNTPAPARPANPTRPSPTDNAGKPGFSPISISSGYSSSLLPSSDDETSRRQSSKADNSGKSASNPISISSGDSSSDLPSSDAEDGIIPPPRRSPTGPPTPYGFRPSPADNSVVPGFSPISISSGGSSSSSLPSSPEPAHPNHKTPPPVSRPTKPTQRVRFTSPNPTSPHNPNTNTSRPRPRPADPSPESSNPSKRLRIMPRSELRASVGRNYVPVYRHQTPAVRNRRHGGRVVMEEQGGWGCGVQ